MVDPHKLAKKTAARKTAAKKATPKAMLDRSPAQIRAAMKKAGPAKTDSAARNHIVRIATPFTNSTHQSKWTSCEVTMPSGRKATYVIPFKAMVAIEEAGYPVKVTGRLND